MNCDGILEELGMVGMNPVKLLKRFLSLLPPRKIIVFESNPDYSCNTYPVFLQLKKELPHYKMVWLTWKKTPKPENVDAVYSYDDDGFWNQVKYQYYLHFAKVFISCNRVVEKKRPMQVSLFLCHGSKTKRTRGSYEVGEGIDYINVQSHFFDDIITYEYNCDKSRLVYLGYPRCDYLYLKSEEKTGLKQKLFSDEACKYIVWLPTFRKHSATKPEYQMDLQKFGNIGMPLVYSVEQLQKLNDHLARLNMYILYKPHPVQDVSGLKAAGLDHIRVINDKQIADMGLQLYEVLGGSDGLITDYSSVYFDYLLLDKPIATTTDDIDEWKKMTGFAFDLDAFLDKSTTRTADLDELMQHLSDVAEGVDTKAEGRAEIRALTNTYFDGNSAKRVADFIKEKIGEEAALL